jgi:hypothetical protein
VGATPTPATNFGSYGRQTDISWLRLSRKQDRLKPEVGAVPTPSAKSNTLNERKSHEVHCSLSKPVAHSQELQAKSRHPNPANRKAGRRLPPGEKVWRETAIDYRSAAQEQSARLIRPTSWDGALPRGTIPFPGRVRLRRTLIRFTVTARQSLALPSHFPE